MPSNAIASHMPNLVRLIVCKIVQINNINMHICSSQFIYRASTLVYLFMLCTAMQAMEISYKIYGF